MCAVLYLGNTSICLVTRTVFNRTLPINEMRQHSPTAKIFTEQTTLAAATSRYDRPLERSKLYFVRYNQLRDGGGPTSNGVSTLLWLSSVFTTSLILVVTNRWWISNHLASCIPSINKTWFALSSDLFYILTHLNIDECMNEKLIEVKNLHTS